jgi:hypothetical protein
MGYVRSIDLRTCPLLTPDDRLLSLLVDLPTYPL